MFKILLFYKYITIDNPAKLRDEQKEICQRLNLKGRIIVAKEGINGTLEGDLKDTDEYRRWMVEDKRFRDIHFKISDGTGGAFSKLSIKVRPEIVAWDMPEINPIVLTGKYIHAEELHDWIKSKKEFYIIDMRNDFEQEVGYFDGSIFPGMEHSRDLPKSLPKLAHLKDKTVVTVCTGGVRCEKASGFLMKHGFTDVYQLYGGIVTYMEKYPNEDFLGALYTFDKRLVMHFNGEQTKGNQKFERVVVGKCAKCKKPSENFINCLDHFCHRHFIVCEDCLEGKSAILCPMGCRDYSGEHPEIASSS